MPLPWPEIRDKAIAFSREWQGVESERAESQTFWNEFFAVFGVPRRRVASFEEIYRSRLNLVQLRMTILFSTLNV
jgi:hypothetical protein